MSILAPAAIYVGAAIAQIAGCYSVWAWLRLERSPLWMVPGIANLLLFAFLLTRIDAGRAYAAYGGVYIVASLAWLGTRGNPAGRPGRAGRIRRADRQRHHPVRTATA